MQPSDNSHANAISATTIHQASRGQTYRTSSSQPTSYSNSNKHQREYYTPDDDNTRGATSETEDMMPNTRDFDQDVPVPSNFTGGRHLGWFGISRDNHRHRDGSFRVSQSNTQGASRQYITSQQPYAAMHVPRDECNRRQMSEQAGPS